MVEEIAQEEREAEVAVPEGSVGLHIAEDVGVPSAQDEVAISEQVIL